jgi:monoamine oxidase
MLYEVDARNVQRHGGPSSHNQSYRIAGGAAVLVERLKAQLPDSVVRLDTVVKAIQQEPLEIQARSGDEDRVFMADRIIMAMPPRLIASSITFLPPVEASVLDGWRSLPTWMAAHSKMLFVYDRPFWREQGLSGEVFSRYGPLTEIYDGSPADESFYALTSFVGLNAHQRRQVSEQQLQDACMAQLERLFGAEARDVRHIMSMDWSNEAMTATEQDLQGIPHHPQYPVSAPRSLWDNRLMLAGTEVAPENGGYLEGALESANMVLSMLNE